MAQMRQYVVALTGGVQRVSDAVFTNPADPTEDIPFRTLTFQAGGANDVFVGTVPTVSSSSYGFRAITGQAATVIGAYDSGPMKLSDLYVQGTNAQRLHIFGVGY